ncbi:MAG: S-layer homology domain-containing protein [Oscillibacter sp.]|jgi:hypothetical protein|nr:S-layer homology domain-containing protein [Oscillibacter sp.]
MKKRISALVLSVVLCLGLLSTTAFAASTPSVTSTDGSKVIKVTGADSNALCALWGDEKYEDLLLLFYADENGVASVTVDAFKTYYVGVNGQSQDKAISVVVKDKATTPVGPSNPDRPSGGSSHGGGGGGSSVSKKVTVNSTKNGSVSVSPSYPSKGNKVTLTVRPNSGYVLDSIKVLDSKGNEVALTKEADNKYTFIMPDGKVTVDAKFVKADGSSDAAFSDVPDTHWAIKEITWAAENGIMNGIGGGQFAPDRTVTRQQLWMVMARLGGSNPADMAAARSWAMSNNISDGTRPGEALTRQQLVAILYRYAQLMGYPTTGAADTSTFPDHATVSAYAKDAMAWAVGNGIVTGTSDGRLNPGGTASRAQFAVIMYRFDQKFAN